MRLLLISAVFLVSCEAPILYSDKQEFDWVEPVIFQHDLRACRTQHICTAEELFDG